MAEVQSQIAFEELGLGSVLKRYKLIVPPNQREYAWSEEEVLQLLHDFAQAVREQGPYFLGTIVTIPRGDDLLEVVDGQQRLATTAILLSAIRDYLAEIGETMQVESINTEFLSRIDRKAKERKANLTLNVDDNETFIRIVTDESSGPEPEPTRASHVRLLDAQAKARVQVAKIVGPLDRKAHAEELERWVSFVEHKAIVVLLRVPNDADAYRMFETLNDRGLRTSQADLIKNFLFSKASDRMNEVQARWSHMRGALESTSDDSDITINFLRHALILMRGYLREADVYDAVQEMVKSQPYSLTFAAALENLAYVYVATFSHDHERWNTYEDSARKAVEVINLFGLKPMRALILAVAAKFEVHEAALGLNFLVTLGVRIMIASNFRSGSVEKPLADTAHKIFEVEISTATELIDSLADLTPGDEQFRKAFETAKASNTNLARYYLRSLEMNVKGEAAPWFVPHDDKGIINLEHVLPRNTEDNWPQFTEEQVRQYATRIGNLALLRASENSNLRSRGFAEKREVYGKAAYLLTSQIAEVENWTPETIEARQRRLADIAVSTWPLKSSKRQSATPT